MLNVIQLQNQDSTCSVCGWSGKSSELHVGWGPLNCNEISLHSMV